MPVDALQALPLIGYNPYADQYIFPELDATGTVCGILWRRLDGSRGVLEGSIRGVYPGFGWRDRPGPVRIPEGASDTLALWSLGLPVIGRSSACHGANLLGALLGETTKDVVVVGENDQRPGMYTWPGLEGANRIAEQLRALLPGRAVDVVLPPAGFKDAREWVIANRRV